MSAFSRSLAERALGRRHANEEIFAEMARPKRDENATWCPISKETYRSFFNDFVAIGLFCGRVVNGVEEFEGSRSEDLVDRLEAQRVCLLSGLTWIEPGISPYRGKFGGQDIRRVSGNARQTNDLDDLESQEWWGVETEQVRILAWEGAYLVHSRCWELLQGYGNDYERRFGGRRPSALTPAGFWMTGMQTSALFEETRQQRNRSFDWLDREEAKVLHIDNMASSLDMKNAFFHPGKRRQAERARAVKEQARAIRLSREGKGIDLAIREEIWDEIISWAWQSPDK